MRAAILAVLLLAATAARAANPYVVSDVPYPSDGLPGAGAGALFGSVLAADSGRVVVGAPASYGGNGSVHVYDCRYTPCRFSQSILAPPPPTDTLPLPENLIAEFGYAIAVRGTQVLVGAPGYEAVFYYVCPFDQPCTRLGDTLYPATDIGFSSDRFGEAVALGANLGMVGAANQTDDFGEFAAGRAFTFVCSTSTGCTASSEGILSGGSADPNDRFGTAVAYGNGFVAVGAPGLNNDGGAVYVFNCFVDTCNNEANLFLNGTVPNGRFGAVLDMSSNILAVGTLGTVYLYACVNVGSTVAPACTLQSTLVGSSNEGFGRAVAVYLGVVAVGAPAASKVYMYSCADTTNCVLLEVLSNNVTGTQFGAAVDLGVTGQVVIGAPNFGDANQGAVYAGLSKRHQRARKGLRG